MTSVVAALTFGGKWQIHDKDSINTSFPSFLNKMNYLGAKMKKFQWVYVQINKNILQLIC